MITLTILDAFNRGELSRLDIHPAWAALTCAISVLITYFPYDNTWAPTEEWIINPLCRVFADLFWAAKLIADKIPDILDDPNYDEDKLRDIYIYLIELTRWLHRLNNCFSIILAHLHYINHFAYDTNLANYQDSEFTLSRLLGYANILRRRFDVNVLDGALG